MRLGVEPAFVEFVFAETRPTCFEFRIEDPKSGWTCFLPDEVDAAYPLWSANADQTLLLVSDGEERHLGVVVVPLSVPNVACTEQGLLARLLNAVHESEASDHEMAEAAAAAGFRFLPELLDFVAKPVPEGRSWDDSWDRFRADIDTRAAG